MLLFGDKWEDTIILLSKEDAINASTNYPNARVEIFRQNNDTLGYTPTYNYYKKGNLVQASFIHSFEINRNNQLYNQP